MSLKRVAGAAGIAVAVALVLAPAVVAGGSASSGYGGVAGILAKTRARNGGLPFTGLDLTLLAFGGLVLVLVGVGLRQASRPRA